MFDLSKIADVALRPSFEILLLCAVGLCCSLFRRTARFGRGAMALGIACLILVLMPISDWPLENLENRFPAPESVPAHVDGIIVLGGAINLSISADRLQPTLKAGADRMTAFVALAHRFPEARLLFTGGGGGLDPDGLREADVARYLFAGMGLDVDRMMFERNSRNTWENALFSKALVRPAPGETWLLVTSAADMPRAMGCFRRVGWPVTAWPVGYRIGRSGGFGIPDLAGGLADLDWATHEWIGLAYYRLRGWTDDLFPAPLPSDPENLAHPTTKISGPAP